MVRLQRQWKKQNRQRDGDERTKRTKNVDKKGEHGERQKAEEKTREKKKNACTALDNTTIRVLLDARMHINMTLSHTYNTYCCRITWIKNSEAGYEWS